ncbi:MAG: hypothetical protein WKF94_09325 [Solirubrobacteraceae bacterium]
MAVTPDITTFDRVELTEALGEIPAGARAGVLELRDGEIAMLEVLSPELDPASRIVFAPLAALRVVSR